MRASAFPQQTCSIARTLEIVGEWWSLLILRDAFFGVRRFSQFEDNLGIAKNVLSRRLAKLVAAGVLERKLKEGRGNPADYVLTEKGRELFPVLVAMMQWGDRWASERGAPVLALDRARGQPISALRVTSAAGEPLGARDVTLVAGPGADDVVERRFGAPRENVKKTDLDDRWRE